MLIPIETIVVTERYRQDHGDIEELAASIRENGLITPIAVETIGENSYRLLAGERRLRACTTLGHTQIECRLYDTGLPDQKRLQIELEENIKRKDMTYIEECKLKRDIHNLRMELLGEKIKTAPADAPGWNMTRTAQMFGEDKSNTSQDISLANTMEQFPEIDWSKFKNKSDARKQVNALAKTFERQTAAEEFTKQLQATPNTDPKIELVRRASESFIYGDCIEGMKNIPTASVDFVEIDPPYGIDLNNIKRGGTFGYAGYHEVAKHDYVTFMDSVLAEAVRCMKPTAWLVLWLAPEPWFEVLYNLLCKHELIVKRLPGIWTKPTGQTMQPHFNLANCYEMFFYARKPEAKMCKPGRSNVFDFLPVPDKQKKHPTERPAALIAELLSTFTIENANVLVPFAGSGRTILEAWKSQRTAIGFDTVEAHQHSFLESVSQELR